MKTRFCPSPTGNIHMGNARTALFCALLARKEQGTFLLRIEDTDKERSSEVHTQQLMRDLQWLGLDWQEGPEVGGDAGPYWQSQRQAIYDRYYTELEAKNLVYPCFCSQQQLAITRKIQLAQGQPPRYAGTCRNLTAEQRAEKLAQGLIPTLRFKVELNRMVEFNDLVKGEQRFNTDVIGDFIIRRQDGTAPFLYCNAIDDALMGVTHVIRGEDHLTNSPRQILILQALGLPIPVYGHLSLILGSDGGPLSKREGSRSILEMHKTGFMPEGINNYLARLGHYYADSRFMSISELSANFSTEHLGKSAARFDPDQLLYWQHEAVLHSDEEYLWQWFGVEIQALVPANLKSLFIATIKPNVIFPSDALQWAQLLFGAQFNFSEEQLALLKQTGKDYFNLAATTVAEIGVDYEKLCNILKAELNVKGKALFQPLRIALTGELHGPELKSIMELLGQEKIIARLQQAAIS